MLPPPSARGVCRRGKPEASGMRQWSLAGVGAPSRGAPAGVAEAEPSQPTGVVGLATRLGDDLIRALPPAFLLMVVLNLCFLGLVMWFINSQQEARNSLINTVVSKCMDIALHAPPPTEAPVAH